MNRIKLLSSLLALAILAGCGKQAKTVSHIQDLSNTPYQNDSILLIYGTDPERALNLLDSAISLGNIDEFNGQLDRAIIFCKSLNEQHQDSAHRICEALLQHDSVKLDIVNHIAVIDQLIVISRAKANDYEYIKWATEKAELCRQKGDQVELLRTEAEIGLTMTHLGQVEEGLAKIDNCINLLDKAGSINRLDAFVIAVKRKLNALIELQRYQEIIPLAQRILMRLDHYEQHAQQYAEDSYRLSWSDNPPDRDRYIDFCRSQAYGFMAIAYASMGNRTEASKYLNRFDESNYGKSFSARRMIVPVQIALGMYDEAMSTCDKMVQSMGTDTMNTRYATILLQRSKVARASGHTQKALDLMNRYATLSKTLSDSLHKSEAHEYAARYHAQEQQLLIQKAKSDSRQKTIIAIAAILLMVIALTAAFYFNRQHRRIIKKNRTLVRMINEAHQLTTANDETADDTTDEYADDTAHEYDDKLSDENLMPEDEECEMPSLENTATMFAYIDATIRSERLYANPRLQRQDICNRFGINRILLNYILQHHRDDSSLPKYINSIRLEEAVKLLRNCPDMSISTIAVTVGWSPANFRVQFIQRFGMSPKEFRQNQ